MRFPYIEREVDALPGIPGSEIEWEPQIPVYVGGVARLQIIPGLVDTGASLTLVPMIYLKRLGVLPVSNIRIRSGDRLFTVLLAHVDLELRSPRKADTWSVLIGFSAAHERALWGQSGFLEHFTATFNTRRHFLTLSPNWTFPARRYAFE